MLKKMLHGMYRLLPYAVIEKRREKQYSSFIEEMENEYIRIKTQRGTLPAGQSCGDKNIYVFWYQGFENAPALVKKCVKSIQKNANGYQVVLLDKDNYQEWVTMEDYILEAVEKKTLGLAHFSDILRLKLLLQYGGIWVDSTVLLTEKIPENILKAKLFVFKEGTKQDLLLQNRGCMSNWFIAAHKDNDVLYYTLQLILYYLKKHHVFHDYYMFHWVLTFVFRDHLDAWAEMPFVPNVLPHYLQFCEYDKQFDMERWNKIKHLCFAHKLSYKLTVHEGSLLDWIISEMKD